MSTAPIQHQATAHPLTAPVTTVLDTVARHRHDVPTAEVPAWAQLGAAIVATSLVWFAVTLLIAGFAWAAVFPAVLGVAIFGGAILPDVLAARWARTDGIDA